MADAAVNEAQAYPYVEVDLGDGQSRRFKYTMLASVRLKQATGRALASLSIETLDEAEIVWLAWALLLHDNPKLTIEQVAMAINPDVLDDIGLKIGEAVAKAFPNAQVTPPLARRKKKR